MAKFPSSVEAAGAGALGALAFAEVVHAVGLTGLQADVLNSAAGHVISTVATNLFNPPVGYNGDPFSGLDPSTVAGLAGWEGAGAAFIGSEIAQAIYQPNTQEGQEGAAVASAVGNTAYLYYALGTGNIYIIAAAAVVAVIDYILGGVIGDLFGQEHTSHIAGTSIVVSSSGATTSTYTYQYGPTDPTITYRDGATDDITAVGTGISASLNHIIGAVGGTLTNASQLTKFGVAYNTDASPSTDTNGYYDSNGGVAYYYDADGVRKQYWAANTAMVDVVDYAILREVSEMQFSGGDQYIKRAIDATLRSSLNPTAATLSGNILIAQRYEFYEANKPTINALIAAGQDRDWVGLMVLAGSMGFGTSVQGGTDNDTLGVVTTYDDAGNPITDRILIGGGGDDTYVVNSGDGNVTVLNGLSSYNLAQGTLNVNRTGLVYQYQETNNNVTFTLKGADLIVGTPGGQKVVIEGWGAGSFAQLNAVEFNGGSTILSNTIVQLACGEATIVQGPNGGLFADSNLGIAGNNRFADSSHVIGGGDGGDVLVGGSGTNTFVAGGGKDSLYGGGGTDYYQLDAPGQMTIYNNESEVTQGLVSGATAESGKLQLWSGTGFDQVSFAHIYSDLYIQVAGTPTTVAVDQWFNVTTNSSGVVTNNAYELNSINLSDSTNITFTDGTNYLHGATAQNSLGISSQENYYLSGPTKFLVNYYDVHNAWWEHDVVNGDGSSNTTVYLDGVANIRSADTIIAQGARDTLTGEADGLSTLVAKLGGETLQAGVGGTVIADYEQDNVRVTLTGGNNDSAVSGTLSDKLIGIGIAVAGGAHDTLTAAAGGITLFGDGNGGVLNGYSATDVAAYRANNAVVNLATGTATVGSTHDVLNTIVQAAAYGSHDTLIGAASGTSYLSGYGTNDRLIGGAGGVTQLRGHGTGSTLEDGVGTSQAYYLDDGANVNLATGQATTATGADTLIGITNAVVAGDDSTITGGAATSVLAASGSNDTLIDGAGGGTFHASGTDDHFVFGSSGGTVVIANTGSNTGPANELDLSARSPSCASFRRSPYRACSYTACRKGRARMSLHRFREADRSSISPHILTISPTPPPRSSISTW